MNEHIKAGGTNGFDVIGDIHGQAGKLEALLVALGYVRSGSGYRPPQGRQALFLGDLIDRGGDQRRVLEIVWSMIDAGDARCVMGNHEFNAIGYATDDPRNPGERLRPNRGASGKCAKNRLQHEAFIAAVGDGSAVHAAWVERFRTLPLFLDLGGLRAAHGCWDDASVAVLRAAGWDGARPLDDDLLFDAHAPGSALEQARKRLTCGVEIDLPEGRRILDKSGHEHFEVRVANWRHWATSFHEVALVPAGQEEQLAGMDWPAGFALDRVEGAPVFIGHHWFGGPAPVIESPKLACLDWSAGKDGPLVAYRWDGEDLLSNDKLLWVGAQRGDRA